MRIRLSHFVVPPKLRPFLRMRQHPVAILDVGCGNHSPQVTKHWFPRCAYFGVDIENYNNDSADAAALDGFYQIDLRSDKTDCIPDGHFDMVIFAHVIEHIENGEQIIGELAKKLKPGGQMYIECPSERSLDLPSGSESLNFYDDPTHVRQYPLRTLTRACTDAGLAVQQSGTRRDRIQMLMAVTIFIPKQLISLFRFQKPWGPGLWDFLGFAQYVIAQKL